MNFRVVLFCSSIMVAALFSCVNDLDEVKRITHFQDAPDEMTRNLELEHTDSGITKIRMYAKISESYTSPERLTYFKKFLQVDFFDIQGNKVSRLTAQKGVYNHKDEFVLVEDSVRLYNYEKDQTMETESLTWNKKDSTIRTDDNVLVRSPKELLTGKGLVTKQDFSYFEILNPTGKINLKKEKE